MEIRCLVYTGGSQNLTLLCKWSFSVYEVLPVSHIIQLNDTWFCDRPNVSFSGPLNDLSSLG